MSKVAVVTDSNSGFTIEEAKEYGVYLMPMPFSVNGKDYHEGVDLNHEMFYKFLEADAQVFTSQPAVVDLMDFWDELLKDYDEIVHIPMSSGLSSAYQTARTFSQEEEYAGKVFVANNQRISVTQRYAAIEAVNMAEHGYSAEQIRDFLEETRFDSSIYITVDTLKYLKKGGRVTPAGAALATVLNIKPVLQIQGEKLDAFSKARGMKKARSIMISAIKDDIEKRFGGLANVAKNVEIEVAHTCDDETVKDWMAQVQEAFPDNEIVCSKLSLSVACHIGYGALAVAATVKHDK